MKKIFFVLVIAIFAVNFSFLYAQKDLKAPFPAGERPGDEMFMPPPLSEQQKAQMKDLRIANIKEVQPIQNELRELRSHHRTLMTSPNPNMAEINKNIDAQSAAMNKLMKLRAAHQQDIRKILTDEQRLLRDMNLEKRKMRRLQRNPGLNMGMRNLPGKPGFFCPCCPCLN